MKVVPTASAVVYRDDDYAPSRRTVARSMELRCAGCAGCCLDWRPLLEASDADGRHDRDLDHERRGPYPPLDDAYNLVPLERDEVRSFLEAGLSDALTPRLWVADDDDPGVEVDGHRVAAIAGRPAFFVGLRKPPKPVAPFGRETAAWLPTCVFLDPESLQCRIYEDEHFPGECGDYPAHNLALGAETECERVERAFGGERLLSTDVDVERDELDGFLFGPAALGGKVFCHPRPEDLDGAVERIAAGEPTAADRAEFVAVAAASSPGTLAVSEPHYERARERALAADSWVGDAIRQWTLAERDDEVPDPSLAERVEDERGAPGTPGWDAVDGG